MNYYNDFTALCCVSLGMLQDDDMKDVNQMSRGRWLEPVAALWVLAVCLLAHPVLAQPANTERGSGPWVWGVSGGAVHQFNADLDDSDGDVSVSRYFGQVSLGYAWDRRNSVSLSLEAGAARYDFSGAATVGGARPWGNIRDCSLSLPIRFAPAERASVIVIPSVRSFVEEGASLDDGSTQGVIAAAGWKFSDKLTLGPGLGWFSELGGGSNVFPIILVDWAITDRLSLSTGRGMAASQGPGLSLDYRLTKGWSLGLTGRYENTRFALDSGGSAPSGRIGEDSSVPLLLTLEYSPWPMTRITAVAGAEFAGQLKLEDRSGRTLAATDFDTAAVVGLVFSSRF